MGKRIFDPIHHFIELLPGEVALLDTVPMQRLRRLRQLGLAYLAFPGAEHTRFSHALGALAVGERVLQSLWAHGGADLLSTADFAAQRRLLRASLLLHDIGHGPFSHASEAVLDRHHEGRTRDILATPEMQRAIERLDVEPRDVVALVVGDPSALSPVLRQLVSGPNLDADRMDYLVRDAYFTGIAGGRYDIEQLLGSLRLYERDGSLVLGVDGRGVVALESFVLARYMMFATVYFHHTTRMFEHVLQAALREIWPQPRTLDSTEEFLAWDDARVLEAFRTAAGPDAAALRSRTKRLALVAEFNAEADLRAYEACKRALIERWGAAVWADEQEQLFHRLPLDPHDARQIMVGTRAGLVDARSASDLIARVSRPAYWRKLFIARDAPFAEARDLAQTLLAHRRTKEGASGPFAQ